MTIVIENLYTGESWSVSGTARQVEASILMLFPWLRAAGLRDRGDLQSLLKHLGSQQAFEVILTGG